MNKATLGRQGKFTIGDIERLCRLTGAKKRSVVLGPRYGADFGVISLTKDMAMVVSTDPLYINPGMRVSEAAWFAFQIMVADTALSGLMPEYIAVDWNLPEDYPKKRIFSISETFNREAGNIGASIVTGHTGKYEGCAPPVLGAGTVIATGHPDSLILPVNAGPGDLLIGAGTPALESSILLSYELEEILTQNFGRGFIGRLRRRLSELSILEKTTVLAGMHGITSMHDASERGLFGAIHEIAHSSNVGFTVELPASTYDSEIAALSDFLGFNPYKSSSEGMLLVTVKERYAGDILDKLRSSGIQSHVIGTTAPQRQGVVLKRGKNRSVHLEDPAADGFVLALEKGRRMQTRRVRNDGSMLR